jgi:nucleotide-binding universal stress UspA family protein
MDKIMVPIDFSSASSWGFYYAYNLAKAIDAELVVLHLYWPPYVESIYPIDMVQTIIKEKEHEVLRHLQAATRAPLVDEREKPVKISYIVEPGSDNSITSIAELQEIDLILMGTHGSGNAVDKVWGSNTSTVIKNAHCAVLAIPKGAKFDGIRNIAYATDFDKKDTELLFQLTLIALAIKANLHCVHINKSDNPYQRVAETDFKLSFDENFEDLPVTYSVWSAATIEEGLETFCRVNKIDVLAMLTHDKTFWDKIFGNKSMTKSVTMRTQLPLLAFHK